MKIHIFHKTLMKINSTCIKQIQIKESDWVVEQMEAKVVMQDLFAKGSCG